jgi:hypothetical protein
VGPRGSLETVFLEHFFSLFLARHGPSHDLKPFSGPRAITGFPGREIRENRGPQSSRPGLRVGVPERTGVCPEPQCTLSFRMRGRDVHAQAPPPIRLGARPGIMRPGLVGWGGGGGCASHSAHGTFTGHSRTSVADRGQDFQFLEYVSFCPREFRLWGRFCGARGRGGISKGAFWMSRNFGKELS